MKNACRDLTRYTLCKFIHIMCSADSVRAERDNGLEIGVAVILAIFLAENAIVFYDLWT